MDKTELKKNEVIEHLKEWFNKPNSKSFYYGEPLETIEKNLQEENLKKSTWLSFDQLRLWYNNNFVYKGLTDGDISDRNQLATYSFIVMELTSIFAKKYPNNPPGLDLHTAANYLADVIIQRWNRKSSEVLGWIVEGLGSKFLKGGQDYKLAGWFIISVACKGFKKELKTSNYKYPKDLKVYRQVLDEWNTQETFRVDEMVSELCEYHLNETPSDADDDKMDIQFSFTREFVYVFEILSWLALREMNGLKNPKNYTHSLMKLSINKLTSIPKPYQPPEIYSRVLARVKQ